MARFGCDVVVAGLACCVAGQGVLTLLGLLPEAAAKVSGAWCREAAMSDTDAGSRTGTRFGQYQLLRLIGRGGFGEVYEAEDTVMERVVALKLLNEAYSKDPVFRTRLQREAKAAGRLHDPHVVSIHGFGEIEGLLYVDMRLIEGTDLYSVLKQFGPMDPARAVAIVRQVAAALDAAHAAGMVHRDVKPENVLLADEDFAYLVDFGIASAVSEQRLTQLGTAVGTLAYMAPERFGDDQPTSRADTYSLACVLFECLTGSRPYRADSLFSLMRAHVLDPIPHPSDARPGLPAGFDGVIAKGMAKKPEDRYVTAGDLARAAQDALTSTQQRQAETILARAQLDTPAPAPPPEQAPAAGSTAPSAASAPPSMAAAQYSPAPPSRDSAPTTMAGRQPPTAPPPLSPPPRYDPAAQTMTAGRGSGQPPPPYWPPASFAGRPPPPAWPPPGGAGQPPPSWAPPQQPLSAPRAVHGFTAHLWKLALASGILTLILSAAALLSWVLYLNGHSYLSYWFFSILFATYLLVTGLAQVSFGFGVSAVARAPLFIGGIALIGLGVWEALPVHYYYWVLALILGIGFLCRGAAETAAASIDRGLPGRVWRIVVGAVSLLAGVVFLFHFGLALLMKAGTCFLIIGICEIVSAVAMRAATQRQAPRAL
jgi:serine/threonine protein kinase/uncharacterized membrane protein HdeD (DUF308 family)